MLARIIIEQRIKDLELAFARQEELLHSQREVLRGLKELINTEISKSGTVPLEADSAKIESPPSRTGTDSATQTRDAPETTAQVAPTTTAATTMATSAISDSAKKRSREPAAKEPKDAHSDGNPAKTARLQGGAMSASLAAVLNNSRRRRSIDKVNQLCAQLPAVLPASWTISSGKSISVAIAPIDPAKVSAATERSSISSNPFKFGLAGSERGSPTAIANVAGNLHASTAPRASSDSGSPTSRSPLTLPPSNRSTHISPSTSSNVPSATEFAPRPESVAVSPSPPALASRSESSKGLSVSSMLAVCKRCTTLHTRTDALKQLALLSTPNDIKLFIESGGREILLDWLSSLDSESVTDGRITVYLEICLRLLRQGLWTKQKVAQTRVDRVLRKLYKRYIAYPEVLPTTLADLLKQMWSQYRYAYNQFKGITVHEEDDGDLAHDAEMAHAAPMLDGDEPARAATLQSSATV